MCCPSHAIKKRKRTRKDVILDTWCCYENNAPKDLAWPNTHPILPVFVCQTLTPHNIDNRHTSNTIPYPPRPLAYATIHGARGLPKNLPFEAFAGFTLPRAFGHLPPRPALSNKTESAQFWLRRVLAINNVLRHHFTSCLPTDDQ